MSDCHCKLRGLAAAVLRADWVWLINRPMTEMCFAKRCRAQDAQNADAQMMNSLTLLSAFHSLCRPAIAGWVSSTPKSCRRTGVPSAPRSSCIRPRSSHRP